MRTLRFALLAAVLAACEEKESAWKVDAAWLADARWDDGAAVVSVYRGRFMKYGAWREAEVRDYLIREHLHRGELTKREEPGEDTVPVLKVNRHVRFSTGTYEYRLMHSLFLSRETGALVKAVASSQDGCGLTFQRWESGDRVHRWDSYWPGEGRGERGVPKKGMTFFADEVPFLAASMADGAAFEELPSLLGSRAAAARADGRRVKRDGGAVVVLGDKGDVHARYEVDAEGILTRWTVAGEQEFERVSKRRLYYWQHTAPGDDERLEGE